MAKAKFNWTDARVANLKKYMEQGLNSREVAKKLGGGISRESVIAKAARLGLKWDDPRTATAEARQGNEFADTVRRMVREEINSRVKASIQAGPGIGLTQTETGVRISALGGGSAPMAATAAECVDGKATDRFVTPAGLEAALAEIITEERVKDMVWQARPQTLADIGGGSQISDRAGWAAVLGLLVGMAFGAGVVAPLLAGWLS